MEELRKKVRAGCQCQYDFFLLIDYGKSGTRDPLVAVKEGSSELLLGWTYLDLGVTRIGTPSFFVLEREGPLSFVPS